MSKKWIFVLVTTVGLLAVILYSWKKTPTKPAGPLEKITLGAVTGEYASLIWIADEKGYFKEQNLEVTLVPYEAGVTTLDDNLAGRIDVASVKEFPTALAGFEHPEIRILTSIGSPDIHELVARKDRGITQVADLKGKKVAFTRKSSGHFFLASLLVSNGLSFQEIEPVPLMPTDLVEAIGNGTVDAVMTWNPYVSEVKNRLGENAISWPGQRGRDFYFLITVREELLKRRPQVVQPLLKALLQAEELVKKNEGEAKAIIARRFNRDKAYLDLVWPRLKLGVSIPQALLIAMEDGARLAIQIRLTEKTEVPNYLKMVSTSGLEALKPNRVTLIR